MLKSTGVTNFSYIHKGLGYFGGFKTLNLYIFRGFQINEDLWGHEEICGYYYLFLLRGGGGSSPLNYFGVNVIVNCLFGVFF